MSGVEEMIGRRWDELVKPPGSLGRLEEMVALLGEVQGTSNPKVHPAALILFAGDHGINDEDVSAYPSEVTSAMIDVIRNGEAAINAFCQTADVELVPRNVGSFSSHQWNGERVGGGTNNMLDERAMSKSEVKRALEVGRKTLGTVIEGGTNLVGIGEIGIGNTTVSSAIAASILGIEPENVVGPGAGLNIKERKRKQNIVDKVLRRRSFNPSDGVDVLEAVGGYEVAALTGVILEAHDKSVPVVLDGVTTAAAALCSQLIQPESVNVLLPSHLSTEPAHQYVLDELELQPLFDLEMGLGEGTGAVLAIQMLKSAHRAYESMAEMSEFGVSEKGR